MKNITEKYYGKSRNEVQPLIMKKYNLLQKDWDRLTFLWYYYGMIGVDHIDKRSKPNHYFLQGILEHCIIEWHVWGKDMNPELIEIFRKEFPQLMTNDLEFDLG